MRRVVVPGGSYCEAWPDGRYIVLAEGPRRVQSEAFGSVAIPPEVETLLYLRGDKGESFAGVNHADHVWEYSGGQWQDRGLACGVNAVIYGPLGQLRINPAGCPWGSQGFRYWLPNALEPVTGDVTYNGSQTNGLAEWTQFGDVAIGQSYIAGDAATFFYRGLRRILEPSHCRFIRMHRDGNILAVAFWKMQENVAVMIWLTVDEIPGLPLEKQTPIDPPPPPPPPPPDPIPMQLPDSVKAIRARYLAKFPIPQTPGGGEAHEERCRQWSIRLAEQVAFELPGQGWGMKRADMGRPISKDTIAKQDGGKLIVWDLLIGTGTGTPKLAENPHGEEVSGQVFVAVAPTNHLGEQPPPEPPPEPPPPEPPPPLPPGELGRIMARLAMLDERAQQLNDHANELQATIEEETRKRVALDKKAQALADDFDTLITWLKQARSTGKQYSHSHGFHVIPPDNHTWD